MYKVDNQLLPKGLYQIGHEPSLVEAFARHESNTLSSHLVLPDNGTVLLSPVIVKNICFSRHRQGRNGS